MEGGSRMAWEHSREFLDRALDAATDYCESTATVDHPGRLFVDAAETPVYADAAAIESKVVTVMPVRFFAGISAIGGN